MVKLEQITQFILGLNLVASENLESWVENARPLARGKCHGDGSILLYTQTYDAIISIERYDHKTHPAELLFAQVCAWIMDNDSDREDIAEPTTDIDILDNGTADIEISIPFEEDIFGIEDPEGTIELAGKLYRLAAPTVKYAETGEVVT